MQNQNSANMSTGKYLNGTGNINVNGNSGAKHVTSSQRVRGKLLMNSGGLTLGQSHQSTGTQPATKMTPSTQNGPSSATKSPQSKSSFLQLPNSVCCNLLCERAPLKAARLTNSKSFPSHKTSKKLHLRAKLSKKFSPPAGHFLVQHFRFSVP